eukprot:scaffold145200_cov61-Attheya_sp.AAC.1
MRAEKANRTHPSASMVETGPTSNSVVTNRSRDAASCSNEESDGRLYTTIHNKVVTKITECSGGGADVNTVNVVKGGAL